MEAGDPTEEEPRLHESGTATGASVWNKILGFVPGKPRGTGKGTSEAMTLAAEQETETASLQRKWENSRFVSKSTKNSVVAKPAGKQWLPGMHCRN